MPSHGFAVTLSVATATVALLVLVGLAPAGAAQKHPEILGLYRIAVHVDDELRFSNTPLDPRIDFQHALRQAGAVGVLDPMSVEVFDAAATRVPSTLDDQFAYGDVGRVQWVAKDRQQRDFEIRFRAVSERPAWAPRRRVGLIGTGDLLRYNAGRPRPIVLHYGIGLHDLDQDGQLDLVGAWDYAHRPGRPWGGLMVHPGVEPTAGAPTGAGERSVPLFGEMSRLRFVAKPDEAPDCFRQYPNYVSTAFADFNSDGRLDVVCSHRGEAAFFLNSGRAEPSGMPIFKADAKFPLADGIWKACRAVDLNQDGKLDLVVAGRLVVNQSKTGWPFEPGPEVPLGIGDEPCFLDLDGDGAADAISTSSADGEDGPLAGRLTWRKNLGRELPRFGDAQPLAGLDVEEISTIASYHHQSDSGVIVQHDAGQQISIFACAHRAGETPRLDRVARAESMAAEMSLSDQAWPCVCDWDDDHDPDLLIGGGYGWPRIALNEGSLAAPAFAEPRKIFAAGKPIRLLRNEILGPPDSWHNMGYPLPAYIDWDADGLKDLVLANETNRIFWYKNVGTPGHPEFGARLQVVCDDYPDSAELRQQSATRAADPNSNNGVYPLEEGRPFMWRTGPALADFNADGLVDLITLDGFERRAVLFTQYRDTEGHLRLKRKGELKLEDGRPVDDRIVQRVAHWTESFRAVDWDRDERIDLIYSCAGSHGGIQDNGSMYLLKNVGTKLEPVFAAPRTMRCFGEPIRITAHGPHPWAGDFDGDGWADLVAVVEWSVYPFYCHAALELPRRPRLVVGPAQAISGQ